MSLSRSTLLYRILLASALIAGATCTIQSVEAKGSKAGGGGGGGGGKPGAAHPIAARPSFSKPNLGNAHPQVVHAKPNLGSTGGSTARTKAPGTAIPPNLVRPGLNPNLANVQPIKLPGAVGPGGGMPTFPPINPGSGIPTTPPYTPPYNPGTGGGIPKPYPKPWLPGSCFPHPGYCHPWIGFRVNLIGWRGGCYVPPVYAPIVTCPVVAGGETVIVNDNDMTVINEAAAPILLAAGTLPEVMVGSQVSLVADSAGGDSGQMILEVSGLALACRVDTWGTTVTATLPGFGLAAKTPAKLHVIRADGSVARSQDVMLIPAVAK